MKKLIFVLFIACFFSFSGFSQGYEPMLREGAQWVTSFTTVASPIDLVDYRFVWLGGDTLVDGKNYTKLIYSPGCRESVFPYLTYPIFDTSVYDLQGLIREDTFLKQVFYWEAMNTGETMIYDFGLQPGDTFFGIPVVDSVGTVELNNGRLRRCVYLSTGSVWVEGLGNSFSLLWNTQFGAFTPNYTAGTAVFENGQCIYPLGLNQFQWLYDNCSLLLPIFTSKSTEQTNERGITVFPNPFNYHLSITLPETEKIISSCTATSMDGRSHTLSYTHTAAEVSVSTGHLPNGVYVIIITTKEGNQYRAKGVKY